MDFFEAVRRRHSVRRFTPEPVSEADLCTMLDAARRAPSATNEQPWHFIVIRSREAKMVMKDVVNAMINARLEAAPGVKSKARIEGMRRYSTSFAEAPVVIAVLTRPWPASRPDLPPSPFNPGLQSVAAAIAHLNLAATALGYGSCWATAPVDFAGCELEAILGVEKPWSLVALVPIGHPAAPGRSPRRRPLEESVTFLDN